MATHQSDGTALPGVSQATIPGKGYRDFHDTGAAAHWQDFYTQETADLVYQVFAADFEAFGYERFIVGEEYALVKSARVSEYDRREPPMWGRT
jgi:hypothetical protein